MASETVVIANPVVDLGSDGSSDDEMELQQMGKMVARSFRAKLNDQDVWLYVEHEALVVQEWMGATTLDTFHYKELSQWSYSMKKGRLKLSAKDGRVTTFTSDEPRAIAAAMTEATDKLASRRSQRRLRET